MCIWLRSVSMCRNEASWALSVSMSAPVGVESGKRVGDDTVNMTAHGHPRVAAWHLGRLALRVEARAPVDDAVAPRVHGHEPDAVVERRGDVAPEGAAALAVDARAAREAGHAERSQRVRRPERADDDGVDG